MDIDSSFIDVTAGEIKLEDLKTQLDIYNEKASTELQLANDNKSVANATLKAVYDGVSKKYGLEVTYDNFREFITSIADRDKVTASIEELVGKQVINSIATRTRVDLITSLGLIIQKIMYLSVKEVEMSDSLTPEIVGIAEKMMSWFTTFSQIQEETKVSDFDKSMSNLIGDANKGGNKINSDLINQIINSFNNR